MAQTKQNDPQLKVRMPPDLKRWIEESATYNGRSQNAEVVFRLQESRRQEEAESTTQKQ